MVGGREATVVWEGGRLIWVGGGVGGGVGGWGAATVVPGSPPSGSGQ